MNVSKIIKSVSLALAGLAMVTIIYASVDNGIAQVNTAAEFDALLKGHKQVVVQFFNPTCPVCMAFKKKGIFGKAAVALPHIAFAMTSSEKGAALHHEYKIEAFPTFIFFRDGKEVGRYKGYVEAKQFIQKVTGIFSAAKLKASHEEDQEKG